MQITKVREWIATLFSIALIIALAIGVLIALGKPVPFLSNLLGR